MENLLVFILALTWDLALGEPPLWMHPVVGLGKIISLEIRICPFRSHPSIQFLYGMFMVIVTLSLLVFLIYYLLSYLKGINLIFYVLLGVYLFKSTFSLKSLHLAAHKVRRDLEQNDLDRAMMDIKTLVGRDTSSLSASLLASAVVESVAENTSDSFVGPLFFFLIFGIPGAVAYRIANTYDSMIGYRGKFEYTGKFAARLDDFLNFFPARITAFLTVLAAYLSRRNAGHSLRVLLRDHGKTKSPNSGWPMSAAAGALRVQLEKSEYYRLGDTDEALTSDAIISGVRLMQLAALISVILALIIMLVQIVFII